MYWKTETKNPNQQNQSRGGDAGSGVDFASTPQERLADIATFSKTRNATDQIPIAIFTIPKSFADPHIDLIQRNAIESWQSLGEGVEVVLIGDESGIAETAHELGVNHHAEVDCNRSGTPLISHAFHIAKQMTDAEILVYCNADVILLRDFRDAVGRIAEDGFAKKFLAIGRRTNLNVVDPVDFSDPLAVMQLARDAVASGQPASIVCKEFFAFTRDLFDEVPDFAVGRGNWDNWMVAHAKSIGVPVIDVSPVVTAIHQNHGYQHLPNDSLRDTKIAGEGDSPGDHRSKKGLRNLCYVSGEEAMENQRLAGGRKNIIVGSTATFRLTESGVAENRFPWMNLKFWGDLVRFFKLVHHLWRD